MTEDTDRESQRSSTHVTQFTTYFEKYKIRTPLSISLSVQVVRQSSSKKVANYFIYKTNLIVRQTFYVSCD